jgi:hypothetical protein
MFFDGQNRHLPDHDKDDQIEDAQFPDLPFPHNPENDGDQGVHKQGAQNDIEINGQLDGHLDFPFPLLSCTIREKIFFREKRERKGGRAFGGPSGGTEPEEFRPGDPPVFLFRSRKRPDVFQPFRKNPAAGKPARLAALDRLPGFVPPARRELPLSSALAPR